jgi:hypothetical protein
MKMWMDAEAFHCAIRNLQSVFHLLLQTWNNFPVARLWQSCGRWFSPKVMILGLALALAGSGFIVWRLLENVHAFKRSNHLLTCLEAVERDVETGNRFLIDLSSVAVAQRKPALTVEAHRQLRIQTKGMEYRFACFQQAIDPVLESQDAPTEMVWWILQLRQKWTATHTYMEELASKSWQQVSQQRFMPPLSAQAQPTFSESVSEFRRSYRNHLKETMEYSQGQVTWTASLVTFGFLLLAGGIWYRWWLPVCALKELGNTLNMEAMPDLPAAPVGAEWEDLWRVLNRMHRRLQLAERFMRDLSMGRTPEPISPEDEGDRLARSSYWLARRWQQQQKELEQRREAA